MTNNQQNAANTNQPKQNASGGELTQKQIEQQKKRKALIAKSQQAKSLRKTMMQEARTAEERLESANLTINQVLVMMYETETSAHEFKTFHDWKKEGFKVNKGEKGFAVWGKPKKAKKTLETEDGEKLEGDEFEYYPMCYLFNENQVSKMGGDDDSAPKKDDTDKPENDSKTEDKPTNTPETKADNSINEEKATADILQFAGPSPFIKQDYIERREQVRARFEERAAMKQAASSDLHTLSRSYTDMIPFGQPILVGHHSEARHRRAIDKSWNTLGKAVKAQEQADHLARKAARVGTGGISSNDPEAVTKLKAKLKNHEESQRIMVAANKAIKAGNDQALLDLGLPPEQIENLKAGDYAGRVGFAPYALQNNNAEIRRLKKRIDDLMALYNAEPIDYENDDFSMSVDNGQIVIDFKDGKPAEEVRKLLRSKAFKWSRHRQLWVRKVTINALAEAERLIERLKDMVIY